MPQESIAELIASFVEYSREYTNKCYAKMSDKEKSVLNNPKTMIDGYLDIWKDAFDNFWKEICYPYSEKDKIENILICTLLTNMKEKLDEIILRRSQI
jgi:hypothetical protein